MSEGSAVWKALLGKLHIFGFRGSSAHGTSFEMFTVGSSDGPSKSTEAFSTSTIIFAQETEKIGDNFR